ncbi:MAG: glutathione S-transferase family protein [Pseudomonadota bacterium]
MAEDLSFWGAGTMRTLRTLWMAEELGLAYRHHPIQARTGETKEPGFLRINPRHKVPAMVHGDVVLTESAAILGYLIDTFPTSGVMVPETTLERARLAEWQFFTMSELDANGLYSMRRHGPLKDLYGDSPIAVASGRSYFLHQLDQMEERLRSATPFLMGDRFSSADILFSTCLDWAVAYDIALPDYLDDYRSRMMARPAYQRAHATNYPNKDATI